MILGFDLIEFFVNDAADSGGLFVEMTQFTESLHPRFRCRTCWRFEFVLDRFRHKLAKWDATFSRD
jgi:hypothetical protein